MTSDATPAEGGLDRVAAWEDRTAWPLFAGAVAFFATLTWVWVDGPPRPPLLYVAAGALSVLWAWFLVDYLLRLRLAHGSRREFVRTRIFDLASLLLPVLRPFLILVFIWRLPLFRHGSPRLQRIRYILTTVLFAFMFVYTSSYAVWQVERKAPGATIVNFGDALWWGFTTITTVGYGEYTPVTVLGRVLAVGLMIGGIVIIGVVTATLISGLNERIRAAAHVPQDEQRQRNPPRVDADRSLPVQSKEP